MTADEVYANLISSGSCEDGVSQRRTEVSAPDRDGMFDAAVLDDGRLYAVTTLPSVTTLRRASVPPESTVRLRVYFARQGPLV